MDQIFDVAVLGAGPAGLTAGLYAGRSRLSVLLIEKGQDGGQIAVTNEVENYPGQLLEGETGATLSARMAEQARRFGAERVSDTVERVELEGGVKKLEGRGGTYLAKSLIIASGASPRPIGCENEAAYVGRGISFCATCDAPFFQGLEVYVVGGGDAAVEEAVYLTKFARKVTLIHRRDRLRAAKSIQERAFQTPKLHFLWDTVVASVGGDGVLSSMTVRNTRTGELTQLRAAEEDGLFGLFGFVGLLPNSGLFRELLRMEDGYIVTDTDMRTGVPGVFAAGDIRAKSLRQVITAAADGAIAAVQAERYLSQLE